ncbi:hypothetical protein NPIL_239791, partial [Nephila pilipes]
PATAVTQEWWPARDVPALWSARVSQDTEVHGARSAPQEISEREKSAWYARVLISPPRLNARWVSSLLLLI